MEWRRSWIAWCVSCVLGSLCVAVGAAHAQHRHPIAFESFRGHVVVENEVIVRFRPAARQRALAEIADADDVDASEAIGGGELVLVHSRSRSTAALIDRLSGRADVEYVEPNFLLQALNVPNDNHFSSEWGMQNTGQTVGNQIGIPGADIDAVAAWDVSTGSRANVVAVLDTGIDYNHPDLAANVWSAPSAFTVTIGDVPVTCPAGSHGFNALTNTCDPLDDNNHGTHCSGIIGAVGNDGLNICGVNWTASILGIKLLDAGGNGTSANAVNAIEFAIQARQALGVDANVRVLSNSYGNFPFSQALLDQIVKAGANGMLFVVAAGNDGSDLDAAPVYPASYIASNLITVAATDSHDGRWGFSNYGATSVHLGAPGVNIISTTRNGGYAFFNGTSMAAPHVAGAAALMLAVNGALTADQLRDGILATVDPLTSLAGVTSTGGRLNLNGAVQYALAPPPTPTPTSTTTATGPTPTATATPPPVPTCAAGPIAGCRTPAVAHQALLVLKDDAKNDAKDTLLWKWMKGTATSFADFGDPIARDDYELCIYDAGGLISHAAMPAGGTCGTKSKPCWQTSGEKLYKYKDPELTPDGVQSLLLKSGADGKASIVLKGKGVALAMPVLGALASPVTAQLLGNGGVCWEGVYSAPFLTDTSKQFKAKSE